MIFNGANYFHNDSYFIRLVDNPDFFLHLEGTSGDDGSTSYIFKEGTVGACLWRREQGEAMLEFSGADNTELVAAKDILGNDGTLN